MPYCTVDDIQALIPVNLWDHDGSDPRPSVTDVERWIVEVDHEIDARLGARYATPISGPESLELIRSISARLVAPRVWGVVFTGQTGEPGIPTDWKEARKLLDALGDGTSLLSDAESLGASSSSAPGQVIHSWPAVKRRPGDLEERESEVRMDQKF